MANCVALSQVKQWQISGILQAVPHLWASKGKGALNMGFGISHNGDP
jgi:hypothetical protein